MQSDKHICLGHMGLMCVDEIALAQAETVFIIHILLLFYTNKRGMRF